MPLHPLSWHAKSGQIAIWTSDLATPLSSNGAKHFPERDWGALPEARQRDHHAVAQAIRSALGHDHFQVRHDDHGAPWLVTGGQDLPLGVTHHTTSTATWAAVSLGTAQRVGLDLVDVTDPRIERIASRFMSDDESQHWPNHKAHIWGAKEAMFKSFGPSLEFRTDLAIQCIEERLSDWAALQGTVRSLPWRGVWTHLTDTLILVVQDNP